MKIEFPGPAIPAVDGGIAFRATVDGARIACRFTEEALADVSPDLTNAEPAEQFEASRAKLLEIAEQKIFDGKVANGVVWITKDDLGA